MDNIGGDIGPRFRDSQPSGFASNTARTESCEFPAPEVKTGGSSPESQTAELPVPPVPPNFVRGETELQQLDPLTKLPLREPVGNWHDRPQNSPKSHGDIPDER